MYCNWAKNITCICILVLLSNIKSYSFPWEIAFQILDGNDNPIIETVDIYVVGANGVELFTSGQSIDSLKGHGIGDHNFAFDINDSNFDYGDEFCDPITEKGLYFIVINNRYMELHVPHTHPSFLNTLGDYLIKFKGTTFTPIDTAGAPNVTINTYSLPWGTSDITLKNSFGGGDVIFNTTLYEFIPANGKTITEVNPNFPTEITAIDQFWEENGKDYFRLWQDWTDNVPTIYDERTVEIQEGDNTYTANFLKRFDLLFNNHFDNELDAGIIKVNGQNFNAENEVYITQYSNKTIEAVDQTINSLHFTFEKWSDQSTSRSKIITPTDHDTLTILYTAKPVNIYRNLTFGTQNFQPVELDWEEHPNQNVTHYKIWRVVGAGSQQMIAQLNRRNTSYTDMDYMKTASPGYLIKYDVRAFYSIDSTYSDPDWESLYGFDYWKENPSEESAIIPSEFYIENYPNPFNPSTNINFGIKESSQVTINIYISLGQIVAELYSGELQPGIYTKIWEGVDSKGDKVSSGIYIYTMQTNNKLFSGKMILEK